MKASRFLLSLSRSVSFPLQKSEDVAEQEKGREPRALAAEKDSEVPLNGAAKRKLEVGLSSLLALACLLCPSLD